MPTAELFSDIAGNVIGGALLIWILVKLTRIETKVGMAEKADEDVAKDIKDHEKRLTLAEPKIARAHERLDTLNKGSLS